MSNSIDQANNSNSSNPSAIMPQPPRAALSDLPTDIIIQILKRLSSRGIVSCSKFCKQWNQVLEQNDTIWETLFRRYFPHVDSKLITNFQVAHKFLYSNLTKGVCASHTLRSHTSWVTALAIVGEQLISGSDNGEIKIWDLKTHTCKATLRGHTGTVSAFKIFGNQLISGSYDNTIKIWDLKTHTCTVNLGSHTAWVTALEIFGNQLISGSHDGTIKIRDLETNIWIATLQGHTGPVTALAIFGEQLISGFDGGTIKIWDLETNTCTATFLGHTGTVTALTILGNQLISGSHDEDIKIWNLETNICTATLRGHTGPVRAFEIFGEQLISASDDRTIKIWNLETNACTATLQGSKDRVMALTIFGKQLISGSVDKTIRIWDLGANYDTVLNEIAELLGAWDFRDVQRAMGLFSKIPVDIKNQVYGKLYKILQPFAKDYWGCAEHAFWCRNGQTSTPLQRVQAIKAHLNEKVLKMVEHLHIETGQEFSKKLNCAPHHLEARGIASTEDLKVICSLSLGIQILMPEVVSSAEGNFRDASVQRAAHERKDKLAGLIEKMSQEVQSKIHETKACGQSLYDTDRNPWVVFQEELQAFKTAFNEIKEKSNTAKLMVTEFSPEKYQSLAGQLNPLVEKFQQLDRDHQIIKLRTYLSQLDILVTWKALQEQGIRGLSALPETEKSLKKLFEMGGKRG